MSKMPGLLAGKRSIIIIVGALCVLILGGIFLTNVISAGNKDDDRHDINNILLSGYNPSDLFAYKSQYIGDASNIGNLLSKLPLGDYKKGISLATDDKPYGLIVNYDFSNVDINANQVDINANQIETVFRDNALIVFTLIKNVDHIFFNNVDNTAGNAAGLNKQLKYQYTRTEVQQSYQQDLWEYSRDINVFSDF